MPTRPRFRPPGVPPPPEGRAARIARDRQAASNDAGVGLRLAIGRGGVGIELSRAARLECITVTELTATLPGIRFPVDVSGGVPRFRHRRGVLQTLQIEIGARDIERWAAPKLCGLVGTRAPEVWVGVRPAGATICVSTVVEADEAEDRDERKPAPAAPVIAFDVDAIAERADLILVVKRARGTDLPATATSIAIACTAALLHGLARHEGAVFVVRGGVDTLARALLPQAGARVPDAEGLGWTSLAAHDETWILHAARNALAAGPTEEALRAREVATMLHDADEVLVAGDMVRARALYLDALGRAPRHGEIVRRILEIDARAPERAEAALATLAEARHADGEVHFGTTPGELLLQIGDADAAMASLERTGDTEPTPALGSRAYEIAAGITPDAEEAARWLDRALVRAPRSTTARWMRVMHCLELGRLDEALADVEHLEALARGGRAKYTVWLRAGKAWHAVGQSARAGLLLERALRYAPDEPRALAGLGAALLADGREARGVAVLTRAIELATPADGPPIVLELARALAERLDDLPAAVARISAIPADAREGPVARGLEGRWRARLGDVAGAALAFARLRELASSMAVASGAPMRSPARGGGWTDDGRTGAIVGLLVEGSELSRGRLRDARGAQRYLAAALRLRPHDAGLRRAYREVGALVAGDGEDNTEPAPQNRVAFAPSELGSAAYPASIVGRLSSLDLSLAADEEDGGTDEEARAGVRVEELTRQLQSNPKDDPAADELASLLESLGRGHELLALLSARLEDATPEGRAVLAPRARAALERLATEAHGAGRFDEASLYRAAMEGMAKNPDERG